MSLWRQISCNPDVEQRMKLYYDEKGLADIRVYLAQWIEHVILTNRIDSTDSYEQIAHQFCEDLKQKLITLSNDNSIKPKLVEICKVVTQTLAVDLYSHVRNGLQREMQLLGEMPQNAYMGNVAAAAAGIMGNNGFSFNPAAIGVVGGLGANSLGHVSGMPGTPHAGVGGVLSGAIGGVGNELFHAHERIQKLHTAIEAFCHALETLHSEYQTFTQYYNNYNHMLNSNVMRENDIQLNDQMTLLQSRKGNFISDLRCIITEYDSIQDLVINELKNWQRSQALAGNGAQFRDNLDEIQRCIELLVQLVCKIISYLTLMKMITLSINDNNEVDAMLNHVRKAQETLVLSAFIVEKQPPQVMKTNTRFAAAVRWLIGPQLGIHVNCPSVDCIILSEAQAQRHSASRTMGETSSGVPASSGEIQNNVGNMEYQQQTRNFSASFRNMQLKKIKRAEKKGTESVMDEKFALLFFTTSIVNDYRIRVWTLSLPVVVIVHGNQEPQSWATITWDNAFSDIVREPFQVPDKVSWRQLSMALNTKFASATGRALTEENLNYLYEKLFRNDCAHGDHKDFISWAQFCKEPLPGRSFTFWDWFFAIMKLTKDHLLGIWKAGLIVGFINKCRTSDEILKPMEKGTFLLRFSDSELGAITIAFVNDQCQVLLLQPWTARDLNIRGLADRVHDLAVLECIYPLMKTRDEAFHEFYSQCNDEQTTRDGYVANTIRAHVPGIDCGSLSSTPHHRMQSPHSHDIPMTNMNSFEDFDTIFGNTNSNINIASNGNDTNVNGNNMLDIWDFINLEPDCSDTENSDKSDNELFKRP